jgi:hypothetical protein
MPIRIERVLGCRAFVPHILEFHNHVRIGSDSSEKRKWNELREN